MTGATNHRFPEIKADHIVGLVDREVCVSISGLAPYQRVTLHSFAVPNKQKSFEAIAHYVADREGYISLSDHPSKGGSYRGIHPMGFIWSMKPSLANPNTRFLKFDVSDPFAVKLNVYEGFIESIVQIDEWRSLNKLHSLCYLELQRLYMKEGTTVHELNVKNDGIHGTLFIPPGPGPFPGVITMFGSHPGTLHYKASLLASHGYASLALAFHGAEGLPQMNISPLGVNVNLSYMKTVVQYLSNHPKVSCHQGFAILGISASTPLALLSAVHIDEISCAICINGSNYADFGTYTYDDYVYSGISHHDISDCYDSIFAQNGKLVQWRNFSLKQYSEDPFSPTPRTCLIPFYKCPNVAFLFLASLDDGNVQSEYFINQAEKQLKTFNHPKYKVVRYPGAGHLLEPPYSPHNQLTRSAIIQQLGGAADAVMDWGGTTFSHSKAQELSWTEQLRFLKQHLF